MPYCSRAHDSRAQSLRSVLSVFDQIVEVEHCLSIFFGISILILTLYNLRIL